MKPIPFRCANEVIEGVPVNRVQEHDLLLSRWGMTWSERLSILFHGKLWLVIKGETLPRILISGNQAFEITDRE